MVNNNRKHTGQEGNVDMRRKLLYICGILWLFALFQMIKNYETEKEPDIITAFTSDMFLDTVSEVKSMAFYGSVYLEEDARKKVLTDIAASLGIEEPYEIRTENTDTGRKTILTKGASSVTTTISLITVETKVSKIIMSQKQYISVDMEINNSLESAVYYRDIIDDLYGEMDLSADVYLYLKGNIRGDISNSEKNSIADNIIENLNGKIVTEKRGADIFNVYAYSENIEDYVVYGSTKTNINVVISYNDVTGMTEVYMATPVMNDDY